MPDTAHHLIGTWRHSHEEDTADGQVYRRDDYPFPPSRGRFGFTLEAGGAAERIGLSPRDGSARGAARWTFEKGPPARLTITAGGA
ncbi:MAG: hypothetical protein IT178_12390, partial [Acidobacteria bacterium]|nr:hypothetical protein [Acidobacteriota bacterium]